MRLLFSAALFTLTPTFACGSGIANPPSLAGYAQLSATQTWTAPQTITSSLTVVSGTAGSYTATFSTSSAPGAFSLAISTTGHINSQGPTPTMGACGSGPSVAGTDNAGSITVGSGVPLSCAMVFAQPWNKTPACVMSINTTGITGGITTLTTTGMTFSFSTTVGGGVITYACLGRD